MRFTNNYTKNKIIVNKIKTFLITFITISNVNRVLSINSNYAPVVYPEDGRQSNINTENIKLSLGKCQIGSCHSPKECFQQLGGKDSVGLCRLPDGSRGVCCAPESQIVIENNEVEIRIPIDVERRRVRPAKTSITITINDINNAGKLAIDFVKKIDELEFQLKERKLLARSGTHEFAHQNFFGINPTSVRLARDGMITLQTAIELAKAKHLNSAESLNDLPGIDIRQSVISDFCQKDPECPSTKYRSADGSCNNLINMSWGKSMIAFQRILRQVYSDGINAPRVAVDGNALPSARQVSLALAPDRNEPNQRYTLLLMQLGQFVDHDLTLTASTRTNDNQPLQCCGEAFQRNPRFLHPSCFPIAVAANDPFYGPIGQRCLSFIRSAPAPQPLCRLGARNQLNQLTSYIDGSNIYGSTAEQSRSLRSFRGGRLRTSIVNNREFLPFDNGSNFCDIPREQQLRCFVAGDSRVNEQTELTVMHVVWLREHNRIAQILSELNPGWNDDIIYQETRRIVVAEFQHIIYNEFLPIIIGRQVMRAFNLLLTREGYSDSYSPDINAGITSAFATAAYRLHTLIQGTINLQNGENVVFNRIPLRTQFNNPAILYRQGSLELLVGGLTGQSVQNGDNYFTTDVTNHLFEPRGQPFGMDLVALNIQRGRDHGLAGYNAWRQVCGLTRVTGFRDLESIMNPNVAQALSRVYRNVDDIDLFIGGVSENPINGAIVGPTFACIIAEQFRRLKNGDRFWFENKGYESSFTEQQLKEIRKSSLARILCDNSNVELMQPLAMVQQFKWNSKVFCNGRDIPRVDLKFWQNEPVWS